jgi:hypothetical protein
MNQHLQSKLGHASVEVVAAQTELDATMNMYRASIVRNAPADVQDAHCNDAHERLTVLLDAISRQHTYIRQTILQGDV